MQLCSSLIRCELCFADQLCILIVRYVDCGLPVTPLSRYVVPFLFNHRSLLEHASATFLGIADCIWSPPFFFLHTQRWGRTRHLTLVQLTPRFRRMTNHLNLEKKVLSPVTRVKRNQLQVIQKQLLRLRKHHRML